MPASNPTFALFAAALLLTTSGLYAQRLNDTGQITCYDIDSSEGTVSNGTPDPEPSGFNEQDCSRGAAAADALGRMAKVGDSFVHGRDYTKIANDGSELPASASLGSGAGDWGCTRDNVTGLIWEVKTDDNGLRDRDHRYTWYDTDSSTNGGNAGGSGSNTCNGTLPSSLCNTSAFRDAVNALAGSNRLCGSNDWRLPTARELQSLIAYSTTGGAGSIWIDNTFFPNTFGGGHWSSNSYAASPDSAWLVHFGDRYIYGVGKTQLQYLRLVRDGN